MKPKKLNIREAWEATKSHVARTRPYGIDRQTEVNTWVATYQQAFCRVAPGLLERGVISVEEVRDAVEKSQDKLILETAEAWGTGH
tara:strand:- start:991 stop:1248 length:258 start_codon:yes stop_codon:yes gene_type:complete